MSSKVFCFPNYYKLRNYNSSIREKITIIRILLEIVRFLNSVQVSETLKWDSIDKNSNFWMLHISKMKRIIIKDGEKYHSFIFPFNLEARKESFFVTFYSSIISSKICATLEHVFHEISEYSRVELFLDSLDEQEADFSMTREEKELSSKLISYLLAFEPGYIRYDHDNYHPEKGEYHPVDHFDINYNDAGKIQVGLPKKIKINEFINYLDNETKRPILS